jgi:hypothetical protein
MEVAHAGEKLKNEPFRRQRDAISDMRFHSPAAHDASSWRADRSLRTHGPRELRGPTRSIHSGGPRGKGRWLVRVAYGMDPTGKRLRASNLVRGKKADAEKALTDLLGRTDTGVPIALSRQTLGEWLDEY